LGGTEFNNINIFIFRTVYNHELRSDGTLLCTNVSPPQRGGAVPVLLSERWAEMARQLLRGARPSGRIQSSGNIFSSSRPLTGRSWTATLFFLYDRTLICSPPFTRLLILLFLPASGNVHPNPGPAPVRPTIPKYPCSVCSHEVGRTSIQCSRCKRRVHSACFGLPGPNLRSMFSRGDVGGWVCPPCSANPPHQAPTTVMNHSSSTVTTTHQM